MIYPRFWLCHLSLKCKRPVSLGENRCLRSYQYETQKFKLFSHSPNWLGECVDRRQRSVDLRNLTWKSWLWLISSGCLIEVLLRQSLSHRKLLLNHLGLHRPLVLQMVTNLKRRWILVKQFPSRLRSFSLELAQFKDSIDQCKISRG